MKNNKRQHITFLITLSGGLLIVYFLIQVFLKLTDELQEKDLASFDDAVGEFISTVRSKPLNEFFDTITFLGDPYFYLISLPVLGFLIYKAHRKINIALQAALVLAVVAVVNFFLKDIIERPRPDGQHLVEASSSSYPSGHAFSSVAFFGFLIYIFWRSKIKRKFKIILTVFSLFMIFLVGFSRIYLGVHYVSDVIAGYLAGGFLLLIFILTFYTQRYLHNNK